MEVRINEPQTTHAGDVRFGWAPTNKELDKLEADLKRKREEEQ